MDYNSHNFVHLKLWTGGKGFFYILFQIPSNSQERIFIKEVRKKYKFKDNLDNSKKIVELQVKFLTSKDRTKSHKKVIADFNTSGLFIIRDDFESEIDIEKREGNLLIRPNIYSFDSFLRVVSSFFSILGSGFYLHSSGIVHKNKAYLFVGKTGSGKSTLVEKITRSQVLSDEIVLVRQEKNGDIFAYSTPFWGELKQNDKDLYGKIDKIFFIHKSKKVKLKKINPCEVIKKIMPNILFFGKDKTLTEKLLKTVIYISKRIPCYELFFPKNFDVKMLVDSGGVF